MTSTSLSARSRFNHLRCGETYRATTTDAVIVGEYLGMETPFGRWAILLRQRTGTESVPLDDVVSILPAAA